MFFGEVPLDKAEGAILAHSVSLGSSKLKKGTILSAEDIQSLQNNGIETITVARLEPDEVSENQAAQNIGQPMADGGIEMRAPFTGRVNLFATKSGLIEYDEHQLTALNLVDEGITAALLRPMTRVHSGQMVGTIKIIPYGVKRRALDTVIEAAGSLNLGLHPFQNTSAVLIMTTNSETKPHLVEKSEMVVRQRLAPLGVTIEDVKVTEHDTDALAAAIGQCQGKLVLILTASATADRQDIAPLAVTRVGGEITRYGIPVDPGNLLFLGRLNQTVIVGLPGCVRAPVINGADLVIERLAAGLELTPDVFAKLSIGGFLKEMATRPQPRIADAHPPARQKIAAVILAAGASRRMRGADKILEAVSGEPLLTRLIREAGNSQADDVYVVTPKYSHPERAEAAAAASVIENPNADEGMAASIRIVTQTLGSKFDAIVFLLGDMPEITAHHIDQLIAAYSPDDQREIIRAASADGKLGHPVLFGYRFFENLLQLEGDQGAKSLLVSAKDYVEIVRMDDHAPTTYLDTPEDWDAWRKNQLIDRGKL